MATHMPVTENTLITIKVVVHDNTRKLKLPLKDLGADKLIPKVSKSSITRGLSPFPLRRVYRLIDVLLTLSICSSVTCS